MNLSVKSLIFLIFAFLAITAVLFYQSSSSSLRKIQIVQYYEKEVEFEDLKNPKFSERKYKHYYGKPDPGDEGSSQFEEGSFTADAWRDYKHDCGKNWDSDEEEQKRYDLWLKRYKEMEENNEQNSKFTEAQSCTMDLTDEEIKQQYFGMKKKDYIPGPEATPSHKKREKIHVADLPKYVNWRKVIQLPVREQQCGDCWANTAATSLESLYQIIGNSYTQFSVQEEINCALDNHSNGCSGGFMNYAFSYASTYGAVPEADQPYKGVYQSGDQCNKDPRYKSDNKFFVSGYNEAEDCDQLKAALTQQPVSVAIDATQAFMRTTSSVFPFQASSSINHGVTVVGYTPDYWIIQNSWGKLSHYNGYVRLAMGNTLNVCSYAQYPTSKSTYSVKPSTDPINFETDFGNTPTPSPNSGGNSNSQVTEGINLNFLIGTKFYIFYETYYASSNYKNQKGEKFTYLSYNYWYIPEGRSKTDFNYKQISFTFVNEYENSFEFLFEPKDGYLSSVNIDGFKLGQCSIHGKTGGFIADVCSSLTEQEKRFFIIGPNQPKIGLYWYKP